MILNNIKNNLNQKFFIRLCIFIIAVFFATLTFNLFLVPNKLVTGGMSGLSIVINEITGMSIPLFLNITTAILAILSFFLLDLRRTIITLLGSLCWNLLVVVTAPIALILNIQFESQFIMLLVTAVMYGICFGLIYRTGWNTGGSDAISAILKEYFKMPMGMANTWVNIFIILSGFLVFGPTNTLCAVFILLICNRMADNVTLGVRDSKMCFVKSKKYPVIEEYLVKNRNLGVTKMLSNGGIFTKKASLLIVIVPTEEYYGFKHLIKELDQEAFLMTSDCYAVSGGYKKQRIPF